MRSRIAWAFGLLALAAWVLPTSASAADPSPKPKSTPQPVNRVHIDGDLRAMELDRAQGKPFPNQHDINFALRLHAQYEMSKNWSIGATYYGVDPFNANGPCSVVANYAPGGTCRSKAPGNPVNNPAFYTVDLTLPAFQLSTLGEAYLDYHTKFSNLRLGNQLINTPFAFPADGRIKPVLFQGVTSNFVVAKNLSLTLDRITRFENRTSSAFVPETFVTAPGQVVPGMLYSALSYNGGRSSVSAMVGLYNFYNIANLLYTEGRLSLKRTSPLNPTIALQYVSENTAGSGLAGIIQNQTLGLQGTAQLGRNFNFSAALDSSPWREVTIPATVKGPLKDAAAAGYFLPVGGTPYVKSNGNGTDTVYYGGIASPYTGLYSGDALFTSSIPTGSMAQRQSAGTSSKLALNFITNNARLQGQLAESQFDFTNGAGSHHVKLDYVLAAYFFGKKTPKGFTGLSIQNRYSVRTQNVVPIIGAAGTFGGIPTINYNNLRLQYAF